MSELSPSSVPAAGAPVNRLAIAELRYEDEREDPKMTWNTPIMNSPTLPRPDLQAWEQDRRKEVRISVLESYQAVHEVHLVFECGSRVAWKTLIWYVDDQSMVPIQFGTDSSSVSDPRESLFFECLRQCITDVVPPTDDDLLSPLAAVYGTFPAPDYSANGVGLSSKSTDC